MVTPSPDTMTRNAEFSDDRVYRYLLRREWGAGPMLNVIGLNPSTADETVDDPTIRRCIRFARDWGYGGLWMTNLFAYRATDPAVMKSVMAQGIDPIGTRNNEFLYATARAAGKVLAAWGNHGAYHQRGVTVVNLLDVDIDCLGETHTGQPKHPLYLPANSLPVSFVAGQRGSTAGGGGTC